MQVTLDIPDQLVAEYLDALTRINGRRAEPERQPEPLPFGPDQIEEVVYNYITVTITQDMQEQATLDLERASLRKRQELDEQRCRARSEPSAPPGK